TAPEPSNEGQEGTNDNKASETPQPRTINVCIDRASAAFSFWCCAGPDKEDPSDMAVITGTDEYIDAEEDQQVPRCGRDCEECKARIEHAPSSHALPLTEGARVVVHI
ncbi:10749_t:CDS:2, partial [Acaulospora colombiana]